MPKGNMLHVCRPCLLAAEQWRLHMLIGDLLLFITNYWMPVDIPQRLIVASSCMEECCTDLVRI